MTLAAANSKSMTRVATHASDARVDGQRFFFAGGGQRGVTALAVSGLRGPGAQRVMAMAGIAIGGSHLLAIGVDAAVGAAFILLLFGEMAGAAEIGNFGGRGDLIGRDVADGGAVLLAGSVANAAIDAGGGVFVSLEIGDGFDVAGGATVRFLRERGESG